MLKRMFVVFTVIALMVVMLAISVVPAFAARPEVRCDNPNDPSEFTVIYQGKYVHYFKNLGYDCYRI